VMEFLKAHVKERSAPLAGNSVHQDRRFLAKYMPAIDNFLHYRIVDVSSVKELVGRWYPEAYSARPSKRATHRALDDIRESIEELRYYRRVAFR
jgi:oligoribonuclease